MVKWCSTNWSTGKFNYGRQAFPCLYNLTIDQMCQIIVNFSHLKHIAAALAYIGEKSRGISPSRGIYRLSLLIDMIFTLDFEISPGISWDPTRWREVLLEGVGYGPPFLNPARVSLHFSSSRGI